MSDYERTDIDISKVAGNAKFKVTYKGRELLNVERVQQNKTKIIAITLEELIHRDGKKCRRCGREEWLTLDHVVPMSLLRDMGIPEIETYADKENLQLLCKMCNGFKANRLDFSDPRTKRVLLRLLETL